MDLRVLLTRTSTHKAHNGDEGRGVGYGDVGLGVMGVLGLIFSVLPGFFWGDVGEKVL